MSMLRLYCNVDAGVWPLDAAELHVQTVAEILGELEEAAPKDGSQAIKAASGQGHDP